MLVSICSKLEFEHIRLGHDQKSQNGNIYIYIYINHNTTSDNEKQIPKARNLKAIQAIQN